MKNFEACQFNHINKTIVATKGFLKSAGVLNSPEYKKLMAMMQAQPTYTLKEREIKAPKKDKETYPGLNEAKAKDFLESHFEGNNADLKDAKARLDKVLNHYDKYHKTGRNGCVKSWIVQNYRKEYLAWDKPNRKKDNDDTTNNEEPRQ